MQANSTGGKAISMGWHPESGFIERNWMAITRAWRSICLRSAHGLTRRRMARTRHGLRPSQNIGAEKVRTATSRLRACTRVATQSYSGCSKLLCWRVRDREVVKLSGGDWFDGSAFSSWFVASVANEP